MGLFDGLKNIFKKEKSVEGANNDIEELLDEEYSMNDVAIEIAGIIKSLYNTMKHENKRAYLRFRILDEKASKNATVEDYDVFLYRVNNKPTNIGYEISTAWIAGEEPSHDYNDIDRIVVKISKEKLVKVNFQYEKDYDLFIRVKDMILDKLQNKFQVEVELKNVERIKPVKATFLETKDTSKKVSFGILGEYNYDYVETIPETANLDDLVNSLNKNMITFNQQVFHAIHSDLVATAVNIWDDEDFNKFIDVPKLPNDFFELPEDAQREILYCDDTLDYKTLWQEINNKSFWNLSNISKTIEITNVIFDTTSKTITIEFNGFCGVYTALIEIEYENNYTVSNFDPA